MSEASPIETLDGGCPREPSFGRAGSTFASRLEDFGEAIAVVTEAGEAISYRALAARADAFARRLGTRRRLVLIEAVNALEPLVGLLGSLRAGHPVMLVPGGDSARAAALARLFAPDARLHRDGGAWSLSLTAGEHVLHPDLALLLTTSGSTGAVKLARLSLAAVDANARAIADYLAIGRSERAITSLPVHYSYGLSVVTSHLAAGATVLLTDRSVIDPEFWAFFRALQATSLAGVPYTYELLGRSGFHAMALPSLRTLTQAGGRLAPELARRFGARPGVRFFIMYGQTEATARMAFLPPELLGEHADAIGRAIPGGAFRLIDEGGRAIDVPGVVGELVYSGPNVMMGYARSAADLAAGAELIELATGDLASRDANGLYRIAGRKSRFIKLNGLRIDLDAVEAMLRSRGLAGAAAGDDGVLAIQLVGPVEAEGLAGALAATLGVSPSAIDVRVAPALPTLPSGKIDYPAILASAAAGRAERQDGTAAASGIEQAFREAFPGRPVDPRDTFASLGGDSLNYVQLSLAIEEALGFLPQHWEALSIAELAAGAQSNDDASRPGRALETEVLVRALAICAVVVMHSRAGHWPLGGGANILLMLAGYNLARFQRRRLGEGGGWSLLRSFLARIIAPYYALMAAYFLYKREWDPLSLLLASNFVGRFHSVLEPYWFLEALSQCLLVVVALAAITPVRRLLVRDPWRFGLGLLAGGLVVKVAVFAVFAHGRLENRTPDAVFWLLGLGWCVDQATTRGRKLMLTAAVLGLATLDVVGAPGLWLRLGAPANLSEAAWMLAAPLALVWIPSLRLPRPLHGLAATVAAASFYIYLAHGVPIALFGAAGGAPNLALNLAAGLGSGILLWRLAQRLSRQTGTDATRWSEEASVPD